MLTREPPLHLQPDPQVQPACQRALQRARRHHRDFRRGAPHPGGQARPQHAACAAQRLVHRLHRHAALQARRADAAHLRRATSRATTSSARRKISRPSSWSTRTAARSSGIARLDLNDRIADADREGRTRPGSDGAAGEAARQGLRGHHRRRPAGQDRRRFRRALRDALGVRQVDAGLHRQDHLRPDVPADHAALAGEARPKLKAADSERTRS